MQEFARGPLLWIAFVISIGGSIYRIAAMISGAKKEKTVLPYMDLHFGLRSILHWVVPFATKSWRLQPAMTVMTFTFHFCLLATPVFLLGHNVLWQESWGISWRCFPDGLSNVLAITAVVIGLLLLLRRIVNPTVRFVTSFTDYIFIAIVLAPFVTGVLAYYQIFNYQTIMLLHMWCGAIWLVAVPFSRISHMLFFPFTRAYMGCEFGLVRSARDW
ncbi:MAG: TmcC family electron transfer complex membrane anchor subunit [Elusimicrobiota bacterium]